MKGVNFVFVYSSKGVVDVALKTKTNLTTDKEQYTRSNAATARPLTLVRLAEI